MSQRPIDNEFNLDDENEARICEQRANIDQPEISDEALPTKLYLEKTTIPLVYEALQVLCKERPLNPIEFFSYYLLTHNKKQIKQKNSTEADLINKNEQEENAQ